MTILETLVLSSASRSPIVQQVHRARTRWQRTKTPATMLYLNHTGAHVNYIRMHIMWGLKRGDMHWSQYNLILIHFSSNNLFWDVSLHFRVLHCSVNVRLQMVFSLKYIYIWKHNCLLLILLVFILLELHRLCLCVLPSCRWCSSFRGGLIRKGACMHSYNVCAFVYRGLCSCNFILYVIPLLLFNGHIRHSLMNRILTEEVAFL